MKKEILEKALYEAIKLTTIENDVFIGYLVPAQYFKKKYTILPLDDYNSTYTFSTSFVKSIQYLRNGVILK